MSNDVVMELAERGDLAPLLFVVGSLLTAVLVVGLVCLRSVLVARAREDTRREVAAYVAEGTMSADDAASILGGPADTAAKAAAAVDGVASVVDDPDLEKIAKKIKSGGCCIGFGMVSTPS